LTGESGRGNLKGAAGCWLCCPVVACRGRLSGGFGARSGAGGIGWVHMHQGEAVTGKGWDVGEGSGMVAVCVVHVVTINRVVGVVIVVVADFVAVVVVVVFIVVGVVAVEGVAVAIEVS